MATSLIDELQLDASNNAVSVSNLLRKALVVAAKLGLSDIPEWINKELSGYDTGDSLPPYRILYGTVKAKSFGGRWIPVQFPTSEMQKTVGKNRIWESVAEIEALLNRGDGELAQTYPPDVQQFLQYIFRFETEYFCFFEKTHLNGILDEIRNQVLRWSIALDQAGIRGEGLTFSGTEKEKAHTIIFHADSGNLTVGNVAGAGSQSTVAPIFNNIKVDNGVVGSINTGTVRTIDLTLTSLHRAGNDKAKNALKGLVEAILSDPATSDTQKNELVEQVGFLSEQAVASAKDRKPGLIKATFGALTQAAGTVTAMAGAWQAAEPILKRLFGL